MANLLQIGQLKSSNSESSEHSGIFDSQKKRKTEHAMKKRRKYVNNLGENNRTVRHRAERAPLVTSLLSKVPKKNFAGT